MEGTVSALLCAERQSLGSRKTRHTVSVVRAHRNRALHLDQVCGAGLERYLDQISGARLDGYLDQISGGGFNGDLDQISGARLDHIWIKFPVLDLMEI